MKASSPQPCSSPAPVPRRPARHGTASQASSARRHARAATLSVELSASAYPSTTRALTPQLADSLLHYSDDDQLQSENLGDLTPTSNRTPSPSSALYGTDSASHSPHSAVSSTGSDASSIMSLPPLSIPPRILDSLHREIAEKSQLLSLANDHIHHQSVQIQHLQTKLTSYQEANNAMLSANVGSGASAAGGRSEEVKQLKVLVSHLYNMIAQRDAIVEEQEKELHYYQQFMSQHKQDKEKEVEKDRERERERDKDRERVRQLEMEVQKYRGERERERKEKEEREERKEQERGERERERETNTSRPEGEEEERKVERPEVRSPPSSRRVRTSPSPPVPPPPLQTESPTSSKVASSTSLSRPSFLSAASMSPSSGCSPRSASSTSDVRGCSPTALSVASFRQSPHGLLPKVRRASPMSASASASSSPLFSGESVPLTRSATPPLLSVSSAGAAVVQKRVSE